MQRIGQDLLDLVAAGSPTQATAAGAAAGTPSAKPAATLVLGNWAFPGIARPLPASEASLGVLAAELRRTSQVRVGLRSGGSAHSPMFIGAAKLGWWGLHTVHTIQPILAA